MKDPVRVAGAIIDRASVTAVLQQGEKTLVFLRGGRPMVIDARLSREELEELALPARKEQD